MIFLKQTDCFDTNLKFWKILGIYPYDVNWKFYHLYSKIVIFLFIFLYDGMLTINFYFLPRELDHFVQEMIFYFSMLSTMSKVVTLSVTKEKIVKIFEILDSEIFQPETKKGMQIITKAKKLNANYRKIEAAISYYCCNVYVLSPIIADWFGSVPLYQSPDVANYFFLDEDFREKFIYLIYLYQVISLYFKMLCNVNIDTFFISLLIFIIAQLELLEEQLITITNKQNGTGRQKLNFNSILASDDSEAITKLNKAVIHYDSISKFCDLVEGVFSVTLFVQFGVASCVICMSLFRLTYPATAQFYMFLASYLMIMIGVIIVPCWFGTHIMDKSSRLSQAIYGCDWTSRSRRFKSSLKVFVERANRPLSITGWKMFPLSLNTFTSIMNSSYSFYTLLRNVQSRDS